MAKFPKMDKSEKEYERELRQFKWGEARSFIGVDFDSSGLARAKNLMSQATGAALKKPYCKVGLVKNDLVFRIKHDKKHHFGEGDIILIRNFGEISNEESLSSKSKNQGVLGRATARDPLTIEWWERTLGSTVRDPSDLTVMIPQFRSKFEALSGVATARAFDETLKALDDLKGETRKVLAAFPAKNDRTLLKKLVAGIAFYEKSVRAKQDQFQAKVGAVIRNVIADLTTTTKNRKSELAQILKQAQKSLAAGDQRGVERLRSEAEQCLKSFAQETSDSFIERMLALRAQQNGLHSDEFPLQTVASALNDAKRGLATATDEFQAVADEIEAAPSGSSPDKKSFKVVDRIQGVLKKLTTLTQTVETGAESARDMFDTLAVGNTRLGKTADEWLDIAKKGLNDTLVPTVAKISSMITKALSEEGRDNEELRKALLKLQAENDKLDKACRGRLRNVVDDAQKAYDAAPGLLMDMVATVQRDVDGFQKLVDVAEAAVNDWENENEELEAAALRVGNAGDKGIALSTSGIGGYGVGKSGSGKSLSLHPWSFLERAVKHSHFSGAASPYNRVKTQFENLKQTVSDLKKKVS